MPSRRQDPSIADLAHRLHAVTIRLLRRARREDAKMGLPPGQASALSILVFGGAKTLSELAAIEQVQAPTMTRMVDGLEKAGLARREPDPGDRRKSLVVATAAGIRVMHEGRARRVLVIAKSLSGISREQRAALEAAIAILEDVQSNRQS